MSRRPIGLEEIMIQAQFIEDRDLEIQLEIETMGQGSYYESVKPNSSSLGKAYQNTSEKINSKPGNSILTRAVNLWEKGIPAKKDPIHRKLSDVQFKLRWEKGLCFRCDEKFSPEASLKEQGSERAKSSSGERR